MAASPCPTSGLRTPSVSVRPRSTPASSTSGMPWPTHASCWHRAPTAEPIPRPAGSPERSSLELEPHQDGIPDLTVGPPVVPPFAALLLEAELAVEGQAALGVGPDLQIHLVGTGLSGPGDRRFQQQGPDPLPPVAVDDGHADVGDPVRGEVNCDVADDPIIHLCDDQAGEIA